MPETDSIPIKTSSLSFEPHQHSDESGSRFWLWRVEIDGKIFSNTMSPIRASDAQIVRYGCTCCGVAGDGASVYAVRRLGDRIFWIYEDLFRSETIRTVENLPETFVFDCEKYEQTLRVGQVAEVPELTSTEMLALILRYLPPASLALYINPPLTDDPSGSGLLARLHYELTENGVGISQMDGYPDRVIEINVGLDLPGFPECRWLVGEKESSLCVMFVAFPQVPCWISGKKIAAAFETSSIRELLIDSPRHYRHGRSE